AYKAPPEATTGAGPESPHPARMCLDHPRQIKDSVGALESHALRLLHPRLALTLEPGQPCRLAWYLRSSGHFYRPAPSPHCTCDSCDSIAGIAFVSGHQPAPRRHSHALPTYVTRASCCGISNSFL